MRDSLCPSKMPMGETGGTARQFSFPGQVKVNNHSNGELSVEEEEE